MALLKWGLNVLCEYVNIVVILFELKLLLFCDRFLLGLIKNIPHSVNLPPWKVSKCN